MPLGFSVSGEKCKPEFPKQCFAPVGIVLASLRIHPKTPLRIQQTVSRCDLLNWERQVSANAACPLLPDEKGRWALRLIHLPVKGTETVWDFLSGPLCSKVRVTRFLQSIRREWESKEYSLETLSGVPREISQEEMPCREPIILEVDKGLVWGCRQGLENRMDADHYFLWHRDIKGTTRISAITEPFKQPHAESWQRLINRSIGAGLIPPRRLVADLTITA